MSVRAPRSTLDPLSLETTAEPARAMPRPALGAYARAGGSTGWSLSPRMRKLVLAAHIVVSVGLLGISTALLILGSVAALTSDPETARAAYRSMAIFTRGVVQPGAILAILTGVILSLGTKWGLVRYYWIVAKLVLTAAAILVGIFLIGPNVQRAIALTSGGGPVPAEAWGSLRLVLATASTANVLMLGAATVISVYKPGGQIRRWRTV